MSGHMEIDSRTFRDTLGRFGSGVVIVTATNKSAPIGFVMQSFMSLSLDPPLIAVAPAKSSSSWPKIREVGQFCVNILAADQLDLCRTFSNPCEDRFAGIEIETGATGAPRLPGAIAYIDCDLEREHDAGDHTLAIGRVRDLAMHAVERAPLLFYSGQYGQFAAD